MMMVFVVLVLLRGGCTTCLSVLTEQACTTCLSVLTGVCVMV